MESRPAIILQGHVDMSHKCGYNSRFTKDSIKYSEKDGKILLKAQH